MENSLSKFIDMGGYAHYVWPSYILAGIIIGALAVVTLRANRAAKAALNQLQNSDEA